MFVNEYVSAEDAKKYDLDGINKCFGKDPEIRYQWTIDRNTDVFLMWIEAGREEFAHRQTFVFWWQGEILTIHLESKGEGRLSQKSSTTWSLPGLDLPSKLQTERHTIVASLKNALTEYKVSGIGVPVADHTAIFEF